MTARHNMPIAAQSNFNTILVLTTGCLLAAAVFWSGPVGAQTLAQTLAKCFPRYGFLTACRLPVYGARLSGLNGEGSLTTDDLKIAAAPVQNSDECEVKDALQTTFTVKCHFEGERLFIDDHNPAAVDHSASANISVQAKKLSGEYKFISGWVRLEQLAPNDQTLITHSLTDFLAGKSIEDGQYTTLAQTSDGLRVIAACGRLKLNGVLSPPRGCTAKIALWRDAIWIPAFVEALPAPPPPPPIPCSSLMDCMQRNGTGLYVRKSAAFEAADHFREKYASFVDEAWNVLHEKLRAPPWNLSNWDEPRGRATQRQWEEHFAVSGRRKSEIIRGYEDLYLAIRPILTLVNHDLPSGLLDNQPSKDIAVRVPLMSSISEGSVDISVHLEIYTSKYNTEDRNFWIKPNPEQEGKYTSEFEIVYRAALMKACENLKFQWSADAVPRCFAP